MIKKNIIFIFISLFLITLSFQSLSTKIHHGWERMPLELSELSFRVKNLVYKSEDLLTIDKYIDEFMSSAKLPSEQILVYQLSIFMKLVMNLQIPKKQLISLQRYAIALKNNNLKEIKQSKHIRMKLNRLIWWTEVRLITDKDELIKFLNKQINSSMKLNVINLFAEKGMVEELKYWSQNLKKNRIQEEFEIAIKKAEIKIILLKNPHNLSKLIETELKKSIYNVMWLFNRGSNLEQEYMYWIFHQMGVFRKNPNISKLLNKIVLDESFLYIKKVNLLPVEMREDYTKGLKSNLKLSNKALQALQPLESIRKKLGFMHGY